MKELSAAWSMMICLLKASINNVEYSPQNNSEISEELLKNVYTLSCELDVAPIIAKALQTQISNNAVSTVFDDFKKSCFMALMRYERMNYELLSIEKIFEEQRICYIPLKGAIMRNYYPEPWMRTSCDIDILVKKEDAERAKKFLKDILSFNEIGRSAYDIPLQSRSGIPVELHYALSERNPVMKSNDILETVWDTAITDGTYRYSMTDEMFYFYHITHMAKHFEQGGCGVRPFIDLWILNHRIVYNREKRKALLKSGGLLKFAKACENLSEVWFGDATPTELTNLFEAYIVSGGMYGNIPNAVKVQKNQRGGKIAYIRSRLLIPYDRLKNIYPILEKHKCLLPVMEVRRWLKMITDGRMNRSVAELKSLRADDSETMFINFLKDVGLK